MAEDTTKENAFEAWKPLYEGYLDADKHLENIGKGNAGEKEEAINFAMGTWNSIDPTRRADREKTEDVNKGLILGRLHSGDKARKPIVDNLEGIVGDAPVDTLAQRFANYAPVEIAGNDAHNARIEAHKEYLASQNIAQKISKGGPEGAQVAREFKEKITQEYAKKLLEERYKEIDAKTDWEPDTRELTKAFLADLYARRGFDPEEIAKAQNDYFKERQDKFTGLFKDDAEKAEYARANLLYGAKNAMGDGKDAGKVDGVMSAIYQAGMPLKEE